MTTTRQTMQTSADTAKCQHLGYETIITRAEWNRKHDDYKGIMLCGCRSMLGMDPNDGATILLVVKIEG